MYNEHLYHIKSHQWNGTPASPGTGAIGADSEGKHTLPTGSAVSGYWMKLGDAADALGVSEITLRRKIKAGKTTHDLRQGRYFVYLLRDNTTGRYFEPEEQAKEDLGFKSNSLTSTLNAASKTLSSALEQKKEDVRVKNLESQLQKQNAVIQKLRRSLEDQATLIAFLEETVQRLATQRA
jgi:hypothetical protein